jgi:hypothetical protein
MVIAESPLRNAARFSTKPQVSTPLGMALFSASQSVSTATPGTSLMAAFIVRSSKKRPPLLRKRSWNMNWA